MIEQDLTALTISVVGPILVRALCAAPPSCFKPLIIPFQGSSTCFTMLSYSASLTFVVVVLVLSHR
ncbi:hypothetical protein EDB84DRAFT_1484546 [Lactarius hengduanensis]|nr:hypothetical protein EDB84DRAFT_1484546 [Lactarius hengduanensis]